MSGELSRKEILAYVFLAMLGKMGDACSGQFLPTLGTFSLEIEHFFVGFVDYLANLDVFLVFLVRIWRQRHKFWLASLPLRERRFETLKLTFDTNIKKAENKEH